MGVKIRWWLHACIELEAQGKRLMIDPHDGASLGTGIPAPPSGPDYVLVTHEHYDHNAVEKVATPSTRVVREREGDLELPPFRIRGVRVPHDEFEGRIRGFTTAYRVEVEGLSFVHLGDLGRPLKESEARLLRPADVVFAPAGGVYTLHPKDVLDVAAALQAKVLVPMHYWLPGLHLPLEPLDTLLRYAKKWRVVRHDSHEIEVSREELPEQPTILVLAPPPGYRE